MHRTQILLDEERYMQLRDRARREGKSMGQLVRELIDKGLGAGRKKGRSPLMGLKGFIERSDVTGRGHDRALYGDE